MHVVAVYSTYICTGTYCTLHYTGMSKVNRQKVLFLSYSLVSSVHGHMGVYAKLEAA